MTLNDDDLHADDCLGLDENGQCEPERGQWDQPPGVFVEMAIDEVGEDMPWCRIHHRAIELMAAADE